MTVLGLFLCLTAWSGKPEVLFRNPDLDRPDALVVSAKGDIYILDGDARKIWCYDASGKLRFKFGEKGGGPGFFETPTDMAVLADGRLVVLDNAARRMSLFDGSGKFLKQVQLSLASIGEVMSLPDHTLLVSTTNGRSFNFSLGEKQEKRPRFYIIDLEGKVVGTRGEIVPNENPLLEAQLNLGHVALVGDRIYYAGAVAQEWIVYQGAKATRTSYKPGYLPREPKAEMKQHKQADGSISFRLSAEIDITCQGLAAINDKEFVMLRPTAAGDEDGIPARLVVVDLNGKLLREGSAVYTASLFALAARRDKAYLLTETEEDGWELLSVDLP